MLRTGRAQSQRLAPSASTFRIPSVHPPIGRAHADGCQCGALLSAPVYLHVDARMGWRRPCRVVASKHHTGLQSGRGQRGGPPPRGRQRPTLRKVSQQVLHQSGASKVGFSGHKARDLILPRPPRHLWRSGVLGGKEWRRGREGWRPLRTRDSECGGRKGERCSRGNMPVTLRIH